MPFDRLLALASFNQPGLSPSLAAGLGFVRVVAKGAYCALALKASSEVK
jgi:hypothetical protein